MTVQAAAPLIETSQGRVSGLIEENQLKDLPLSGRNFFNLVVLTPGVLGRATGGTQAYAQSSSDLYSNEFGVNMNANGARSESNNFLIDSSTVSSSQRSGVVNINPNTESVQEVRVAVNNFSAEYGRNGSVLVNIVTKSGTNDLHGGASYYFTNNDLQARNYFERTTPDFSRKEFSWGVGGPILRDHTFFFTSGDVLRSAVAISGDRTVITPDFARFMQQNRPNNVSTYVMNTFPASFTPERNLRTAGSLLGADCSGSTPINSPVGSIPCNLPVFGVGTWNDTSPRNGLQWTARVDHHFNEGRDRLYGSINRTTTDKVGFGEPSVYPAFTAPSPTNSMHVNSNYTKILSPAMINEASFSWVRPWGELTNPYPEVPGITIGGGIVGYQQGFGPNEFVQNSFEWRDVVTWTRGSHSMKIGGAYTREHADNDSSRTYNRPTYDFNNVFDFAADSPRAQANLGIDPATGRGRDTSHPLPSHAVGLGVRAGRLEGQAESERERGPALRGVPQHLRRVRRHGQHRDGQRRRSAHAAGGRTRRGASLLPRRRTVERRPAHVRAARQLRVGSIEGRTDVDPRRHRPLVRSHVEPDLGLRTSQSAGIRDRHRAVERPGRTTAGVRPRTQSRDAVRLSAAAGPDGRTQSVRRPRQRPRPGPCRRSGLRRHVSRQLVPRRPTKPRQPHGRGGGLPRLARPQRVSQVRHQPVQRRHAGRALRWHPAGVRGDQLHGVDR